MVATGLAPVLVAGVALAVAWRRGHTNPVSGTSAGPTAAAESALLAVPSAGVLPGTPPRLAWPSTGQATVAVDGVGSLGATADQRPAPIASLAKVMTAYLVLHDHPMDAGGDGASLSVTKAEADAYPSEVAENESLVKVATGEVLTERQALEALLLPSADNIARILARWDAGSVAAFTSRMNATAATLGMTATHYTDPSGYDPATRSTAGDQVVLATDAIRLPAFAQIVAMPAATIPVEGIVHNYNTLLGSDGVVGIKTGSTSWAGGCLVFAAHHQVGSRTVTIIGAVLGQHGATMHGLPEALTASARLIASAAGTLSMFAPIRAGQKVATVNGSDAVAATDLTIVGWPGLPYQLSLTTGSPRTPTSAVGRLDLRAGDERATIDVVP
jgi:serine-type D-Ala-D-Ala carboxypeptidase (penicillin-binding protein 5/6)